MSALFSAFKRYSVDAAAPVDDVDGIIAVSGTSVYRSAPIFTKDLRFNVNWGFVVHTTGTLTGTINIEVTNDSDDAIAAGTARWIKYTAAITTFAGTALTWTTGDGAISGVHNSGSSNPGVLWRAFRFVYTNATNSGTIEVLVQKLS